MKKYQVKKVPYKMKDELKQIKPVRAYQRWIWKQSMWVLILQDNQITKKFEKMLKQFITDHGLSLNVTEWDGTNKDNNYI